MPQRYWLPAFSPMAQTVRRQGNSPRHVKRRMVRHRAMRNFTGKRQAHEVFGRDVLDGQRLAVAEAEALVVGGVADEEAAVGAELTQGFDAGFDQARADALALTFGCDGDRAEGEHYVEAWHRTPGPDARLVIVLGRYLDRYERRDGIWKFSYRSLVFDHGSIQPVDEEEMEMMRKDAPNGRSDRGDPSFAYSLLAGLGA